MDYKDLKIPNHVAIIVDGNGRWAKERNLPRSKGHDTGFENLKKLGLYIFSKGIKYLSVYVFSTENFKRDKKEVDHLMNLFVLMFKRDKDFFMKNNIKVVFSGRDEPLPKKVIEARNKLTEMTKSNTGGVFNVCLNYGGRAEIVDAAKKIVREGLSEKDITEETFKKYLYQDLPDVDFMIRTSGELRLSNFLLWELSYAEFYFPEIKFPSFTTDDFDDAILVFNKRDRRFGNAKK
ncbi:MAG: di-trans,poly-cis-decaprenylcistransferase [Bacilli bacterium]|nr:di-trans,poly-cis-decaprenylcistransferase [Bacilli bacterium]